VVLEESSLLATRQDRDQQGGISRDRRDDPGIVDNESIRPDTGYLAADDDA
jgi:hypothetical protein